MFDPDLDEFKKKYDEGFDFNEVLHQILKRPEKKDEEDTDRDCL